MDNLVLPYTAMSVHVPDVAINFEHHNDFKHAEYGLKMIRSTRSGALLLNRIRSISTDEKKLMIRVNHRINTGHITFLTKSQIERFKMPEEIDDPDHQTAVKVFAKRKLDGEKGEGVNTVVSYNPCQTVAIDPEGYPVAMNDGRHSIAMLAHELIHAYHAMNGTSMMSKADDVWFYGKGQRLEEERATGIGRFQQEPFSENSIRYELGYPMRASYFYKNALPLT